MYEISRDIERILVGKEELNGICDRLAAQITAEYGDSPRDLVMVVVLKGSVMFATDLVRRIPRHVCLEFMKVSSYGAETESSGFIQVHLDLKRDVKGADVIIIEDIVDSVADYLAGGWTAEEYRAVIRDLNPDAEDLSEIDTIIAAAQKLLEEERTLEE